MTFCFTGAGGSVKDPEVLTAGMVGKQIRLEFSQEWDELQKTAVFIGGDTVRNVRNAGEIVEIPHEVLKTPLSPLYVGVYGISLDGSLVIPTIRVQGPMIKPGTTPSGDDSTDPTLPLWASMEKDIALLRKEIEKMNGLSDGQISALDGMFQVCAYDGNANYCAAYEAFKTAFPLSDSGDEEEPDTPAVPDEPVTPEKTLTSISAAYSGGDVAMGTAVTLLTGVVVTAHYSDGTSETVTGYTLSGTIAEGVNTVTVSYGGKSTTISVTGVAESGGDSHEGVSAINWLLANSSYGTSDQNNTWKETAEEPDNGYLVKTTVADGLVGVSADQVCVAWPLTVAKTYRITITNAAETVQWFQLFAGTLEETPVKGEISAVAGTLTTTISGWGNCAAQGIQNYTYTAGSNEWLFIGPNTANVLTITAEVTA